MIGLTLPETEFKEKKSQLPLKTPINQEDEPRRQALRSNEERGSAALPSKDDEEAFRTPTSEESKLPSVAPS
ncbi:hypothetical protein C4D60_Mb10t21630 [Musa balbisiana]|uniref:Uncharacterized protein n=1 Tax=Musa balbisiana TaxID=52838 RepID=A0A4S8IYR2_MUSBA|nr:hypothetical protein C4D60_Mb10t21630 [Musa balbisiana]